VPAGVHRLIRPICSESARTLPQPVDSIKCFLQRLIQPTAKLALEAKTLERLDTRNRNPRLRVLLGPLFGSR